MKFLYLTLILATILLFSSQAEAACKATACKCAGVPNGLFCGDVDELMIVCGGDGKKSCDFGKRDSCVKCNALKC
ncbi:hypothetical protein [Absidia glauca]|uniref:Uncharacterized protein n=1 Tax=Absidia glauca TaxID=4829 RepID=A0A163TH19_ABSGL|nr:hypothetical protein [Absidia glauca]